MELTTSSCFLSSKALALEGLLLGAVWGCLWVQLQCFPVRRAGWWWHRVPGGCMCDESTLCMPWLDGPSPCPVCDTCPAQQSWGFVLIRCLWSTLQSAEAPAQHQALQEQILLETKTFPAAPEAEAPVVPLGLHGHFWEWWLAWFRGCAVLPSGAANTLEYVLLILYWLIFFNFQAWQFQVFLEHLLLWLFQQQLRRLQQDGLPFPACLGQGTPCCWLAIWSQRLVQS